MPKKGDEPNEYMKQLHESLINRDTTRFNSNTGTKYITSNGTAAKYIQYLRLLNNGENFNNFDFLKDIDAVKSKIQHYKITTQRNFISGIISVLSMYSSDKRYAKLLDMYKDELFEILDKIKTLDPNERTETQKANWVSMDDIQKKFNALYDKFMNYKDKSKLWPKDYNSLLQLVLLSLYTLIPPRRSQDYAEMYLTNGGKDLDVSKNYFDIDGMHFIFNTYKTQQTYGEQIEELTEENDAKLLDILEVYLKHHPILKSGDFDSLEDVRFLVTKSGGRLYSTYINKILRRIFNKNVGPSILRAVYTSYILAPEIEKLEDTAESMGTSVNKLRQVYNKKDLY